MQSLKGQTALVTGGGQGIGRGIALQLARAGANLIIAQRNQITAAKIVTEIIEIGRKAIAIPLDVTNTHSVKNCILTALQNFPQIEILINNSGAIQTELGSNIPEDDFDLCYQVNLKGLWRVTTALSDHLKSHGKGKIINISSIGGRQPDPAFPAYCASKAAVISLTQSLASELGPFNINVNTICPGTIWTPMWEIVNNLTSDSNNSETVIPKAAYLSSIASTALKRCQTPEDIGHAAVFLASDFAKNITGQAINVDGGQIMS